MYIHLYLYNWTSHFFVNDSYMYMYIYIYMCIMIYHHSFPPCSLSDQGFSWDRLNKVRVHCHADAGEMAAFPRLATGASGEGRRNTVGAAPGICWGCSLL